MNKYKFKKHHCKFYAQWIPWGWEDYWIIRYNKKNINHINSCKQENRWHRAYNKVMKETNKDSKWFDKVIERLSKNK